MKWRITKYASGYQAEVFIDQAWKVISPHSGRTYRTKEGASTGIVVQTREEAKSLIEAWYNTGGRINVVDSGEFLWLHNGCM